MAVPPGGGKSAANNSAATANFRTYRGLSTEMRLNGAF